MEGTFVLKFGSQSSFTPGLFYYHMNVRLDRFGRLFVADSYNHRIQVLTIFGTFITQLGTEGSGDGQLDTPFSVYPATPCT